MTARFATLALGFGLGAMIALPTPSWTAEPSEVGTSPATFSVLVACWASIFAWSWPFSPMRGSDAALVFFFITGTRFIEQIGHLSFGFCDRTDGCIVQV